MNENAIDGLRPSSEVLERELLALGGSQAPARLLPAVLATLGLADAYTLLQTAIGPVFVAYNERGVSRVSLGGTAADFERRFKEQMGRPTHFVAALPPRLAHAIAERLRGNRQARIEFDLRGLSEFEQAVLRKALEIPRGEVRPYSWIAKEIGRPKAVRAVGNALNHNPVPLLIPCHRVVKSGGQLGGYAFGPAVKERVLESEGLDLERLEKLAQHGVRYYGSDTTHIYCYPTCRHARRVMDKHLMTFPSEAAAQAAGYRACKICRPVEAA